MAGILLSALRVESIFSLLSQVPIQGSGFHHSLLITSPLGPHLNPAVLAFSQHREGQVLGLLQALHWDPQHGPHWSARTTQTQLLTRLSDNEKDKNAFELQSWTSSKGLSRLWLRILLRILDETLRIPMEYTINLLRCAPGGIFTSCPALWCMAAQCCSSDPQKTKPKPQAR